MDPQGPVVADAAVDANAERDPFIYNPFARTKDAAATAVRIGRLLLFRTSEAPSSPKRGRA